MKCRHCLADLELPFVDLGNAPPSNAYLTKISIRQVEKWFPLRVFVCTHCWLVQTEDFAGREEFFNDDYAYFSSYSRTWLTHAENYAAKVTQCFDLNKDSHVLEVGANDGYLLQFFKKHNIPCTGIEPTKSTAETARGKGIHIVEDFFSKDLARKLLLGNKQADLIVANNVLAHVPDIKDFVSGFKILLKPQGVVTFEFPHILNLVEQLQFDTIYHEHYSYLSLTTVSQMFAKAGLSIFNVETLDTHGGSLRVYAQRSDIEYHLTTPSVNAVLLKEEMSGICRIDFYQGFQEKIETIKLDLLNFLVTSRKYGKRVVAYGAAAKGNTLLNYSGVRPDLLPYVVDRNPIKQGKYLPGSRIPIVNENYLQIDKPNFVFILPWNLENEIINQLSYIREWNGKFLIAIPRIKVL